MRGFGKRDQHHHRHEQWCKSEHTHYTAVRPFCVKQTTSHNEPDTAANQVARRHGCRPATTVGGGKHLAAVDTERRIRNAEAHAASDFRQPHCSATRGETAGHENDPGCK